MSKSQGGNVSVPKELHHTTEFWHEGELWVEETKRYCKAKVVEYPEGCWTVLRPTALPKLFVVEEDALKFAEDGEEEE